MDNIKNSKWWMVNWSSIPADQDYVATDKNGNKHSFSEKPSFNGECWTVLRRNTEPCFLDVCELNPEQSSETLLSRHEHLLNGLSLFMQHLNELKSQNKSVDALCLEICCTLIDGLGAAGLKSTEGTL